MCHWVSVPTQSCWSLLVEKPQDRLLRVFFISLQQKLVCTKCCYRHVDEVLHHSCYPFFFCCVSA